MPNLEQNKMKRFGEIIDLAITGIVDFSYKAKLLYSLTSAYKVDK